MAGCEWLHRYNNGCYSVSTGQSRWQKTKYDNDTDTHTHFSLMCLHICDVMATCQNE